MSTYSPETKIYYGPLDSDHRLIPSPTVSISIEFNYSNDTIIGYTYIVNLTGSVTALDLRNLSYGDEIPASSDYNSGAVIDHIRKLRNILVQNGNILHIVNGSNDSHILKAKGGILRSFNTDESPNNWTHYASYSASLEFHSVDFLSSTENCDSIFLDPTTFSSAGILDITKYKIKNFQDSWNFTFNESDLYNKVKQIDNGINLNINNHSFSIQYSISATGKHFFDYTNEATGSSTILPAWEQAKNFVQDRLYSQVTNLIDQILKDDYTSACDSNDTLKDILIPGSGSGLLQGLGDSKYKIFNETITCETSESEGSFSLTYNAIVKTTLGNSQWSSIDTKHTITKSITTTNSNGIPITSLSLKGTIEGLIEGGLVRINQPLTLPKNGSLLISANQNTNKYTSAKNLLDKIYNENDYNNGLGECGKRDLKPYFKQALGITLDDLNTNSNPNDCILDAPHPSSFNLTHDYNAGTINYSLEYNKNQCGRKFNAISIQTTNPNKVIVSFNIPNSNNCPLVQELGTYTAKTVNLTIQGIDMSEIGQPSELNLVNEINSTLNLNCYDNGYMPIPLPSGNFIITQQQYTKNPIDGSYTVNMSYICGTSGCPI